MRLIVTFVGVVALWAAVVGAFCAFSFAVMTLVSRLLPLTRRR
jgi:hypothetical protein